MVLVVGVFCALPPPPLDRRTGAAPSWRNNRPWGLRPGLYGNLRKDGDAGGGRHHNHVTSLMNTRMNTASTETANQNPNLVCHNLIKCDALRQEKGQE